jgi:hypothetical protein
MALEARLAGFMNRNAAMLLMRHIFYRVNYT